MSKKEKAGGAWITLPSLRKLVENDAAEITIDGAKIKLKVDSAGLDENEAADIFGDIAEAAEDRESELGDDDDDDDDDEDLDEEAVESEELPEVDEGE